MRLPTTLGLILGLCQLCTCVIVYTTSITQRPGSANQGNVNIELKNFVPIVATNICSMELLTLIGQIQQVDGRTLIHPPPPQW